jgi:hypothetical protein
MRAERASKFIRNMEAKARAGTLTQADRAALCLHEISLEHQVCELTARLNRLRALLRSIPRTAAPESKGESDA